MTTASVEIAKRLLPVEIVSPDDHGRQSEVLVVVMRQEKSTLRGTVRVCMDQNTYDKHGGILADHIRSDSFHYSPLGVPGTLANRVDMFIKGACDAVVTDESGLTSHPALAGFPQQRIILDR